MLNMGNSEWGFRCGTSGAQIVQVVPAVQDVQIVWEIENECDEHSETVPILLSVFLLRAGADRSIGADHRAHCVQRFWRRRAALPRSRDWDLQETGIELGACIHSRRLVVLAGSDRQKSGSSHDRWAA